MDRFWSAERRETRGILHSWKGPLDQRGQILPFHLLPFDPSNMKKPKVVSSQAPQVRVESPFFHMACR